jgi:hypothetical protein
LIHREKKQREEEKKTDISNRLAPGRSPVALYMFAAVAASRSLTLATRGCRRLWCLFVLFVDVSSIDLNDAGEVYRLPRQGWLRAENGLFSGSLIPQ